MSKTGIDRIAVSAPVGPPPGGLRPNPDWESPVRYSHAAGVPLLRSPHASVIAGVIELLASL
jgi:hypothetical protein